MESIWCQSPLNTKLYVLNNDVTDIGYIECPKPAFDRQINRRNWDSYGLVVWESLVHMVLRDDLSLSLTVAIMVEDNRRL